MKNYKNYKNFHTKELVQEDGKPIDICKHMYDVGKKYEKGFEEDESSNCLNIEVIKLKRKEDVTSDIESIQPG
jgi:hypothetical protein